jgi:hypothetical protein
VVYRLAADAVLLLHGAFILFAVLGGVFALRWRRAIWLHLPAAAWGVYVEASGTLCPLTTWENRLRLAAGDAGYEGSFVERYLLPLIYPEALTREVQWWLAGAVLVINLLVYAAVFCYGRRLRRGGTGR